MADLGCYINFTNEQMLIVLGNYLPVETLGCIMNSTELYDSNNSLASSPKLCICEVDLISLHHP